jgi:hypothetical protein
MITIDGSLSPFRQRARRFFTKTFAGQLSTDKGDSTADRLWFVIPLKIIAKHLVQIYRAITNGKKKDRISSMRSGE